MKILKSSPAFVPFQNFNIHKLSWGKNGSGLLLKLIPPILFRLSERIVAWQLANNHSLHDT